MSAEKGLAWFDLGDGRIVKGRSFWFNAELPETWEGREFITHLERLENDEIGLAEWVDEQILSMERRETESQYTPRREDGTSPTTLNEPRAGAPNERTETTPEPTGPFKLNLMPRGLKPRGAVTALPKGVGAAPEVQDSPPVAEKKSAPSAPAEPPTKPPTGGSKSGPAKPLIRRGGK